MGPLLATVEEGPNATARAGDPCAPCRTTRSGPPRIAPRRPNDDAELEAVLASLKTNIKVVGCGGGGCNTINRLAEEGLSGAEMIACNTDAQHLLTIHAPKKILLGRRLTRGLGAGALPQVGEQAAHEAEDELKKALADSDMVFITLGLGGGTGTGSAPVVAQMAKDANGGTPSRSPSARSRSPPRGWSGPRRRCGASSGSASDRHRHHDPQRQAPRTRPPPPDPDGVQGRGLGAGPGHPGDHRDHHPPRASSTSTSTTSGRS